VLYIATEGPLGLSALRAARRLGISVVSGFHTNFQQYTSQYGLGLLTRMLTHYLRWFHNRSAMTLVPSVSQRLELERRHFERLALLSRGVDSQLFHPSKRLNALREQWGLSEQDIAVIHVGRHLSTAQSETDRRRRRAAAASAGKGCARGGFLRCAAR
jgi:hypothetical protein